MNSDIWAGVGVWTALAALGILMNSNGSAAAVQPSKSGKPATQMPADLNRCLHPTLTPFIGADSNAVDTLVSSGGKRARFCTC